MNSEKQIRIARGKGVRGSTADALVNFPFLYPGIDLLGEVIHIRGSFVIARLHFFQPSAAFLRVV